MPHDGAMQAPFALHVLPPQWRAVDFISDLHLCAAMPATWRAWARHLQATDADAVVILGDLFEVWVGDDARTQTFERSCVEVLVEASRRLALWFMPGNRDFLLGPAMTQACGMQALEEPSILQAWGRRVVVSHGDVLCLADTAYQQFRRMVRSAEWQQDFLSRPLQDRLDIAAHIRSESRSRQAFDGLTGVDADPGLVEDWLQQAHADVLVHGHTHRPADHGLPAGRARIVLSDWDCDQTAPPRAEVLRWTAAGFERRPPAGPR